MIKSHGTGFITVGDKRIPIKDFTLDATIIADTLKMPQFMFGAFDPPNVIDSTATVINDDVKALPAPDEVK